MTKTIRLTGEYEAIVDDEDYDYITQFNWHVGNLYTSGGPYAVRIQHIPGERSGKWIGMHREILARKLGYRVPGSLVTDHIDGNGLNNTRENLRPLSLRENARYRPNQKASSKHSGIHWHKCKGKWQARISYDGKQRHIGYFDNEEEAWATYLRVAENLGLQEERAAEPCSEIEEHGPQGRSS